MLNVERDENECGVQQYQENQDHFDEVLMLLAKLPYAMTATLAHRKRVCATMPVDNETQLMDDLGSRCQMVEELATQREQGLVLCFMKLSMVKRNTAPYQR